MRIDMEKFHNFYFISARKLNCYRRTEASTLLSRYIWLLSAQRDHRENVTGGNHRKHNETSNINLDKCKKAKIDWTCLEKKILIRSAEYIVQIGNPEKGTAFRTTCTSNIE